MARNAQTGKGVDQPMLVDALVEKGRQAWRAAIDGTGLDAGNGHVVERLAGPSQRTDHILLVEPGTLVEIAVFAIDQPFQFDGQKQFNAQTGMF